MTNYEKEQILKLRAEGRGYKLIAKELGVCVSSVAYICKQALISKCKYCGKKLSNTPGHRQKEYCSEKCRSDWLQLHPEVRKLKAYYKATCKECGKEFEAYGNNHRKFCCWKCYIKFRNKPIQGVLQK